MAILQPENTDQLKDNHPLMHKAYAIFPGAPAQHAVIDAAGNIYIGDFPHGNYVKISPAGQILFVKDARIVRHFEIDPARFKLPGNDYPGESFEGLFYTLDFDKNTEQSAYAQDDIPFIWDDNTDMEVVINWLHDGVDAGKVVWGIEYISLESGEVVAGATTTITQESAGNHLAGVIITTTFITKILKAKLKRDDHFAIRLFRDATNENDTLNEDAKFIDAHFHFTANNLGCAC